MPLTMSMEILAEGGSCLMPDLTLVGMRDVRAHRWIALERPPVSLQITAVRQSDEAVHVQIRERGQGDAETPPTMPIIEGVMVFSEAHPEPPRVGRLTLDGEAQFNWAPDDLYTELMFHGPSMQGVASMNRVGVDGAEATLAVLPTEGMFARGDASKLVIDGNLLDQVGQVIGFWAAQVPDSPCLVPPFRLDTLHLYGAPLRAGSHVTCQARTTLTADRQVRSEFDVIDPSGRPWARLEGWQNRRFPLPPAFYRYLLSTRDLFLSRSWTVPAMDGVDGCRAFQLGVRHFLDGWFTTHGGFWRRVLAHLVLGRRERELWYAMRGTDSRRTEWLLGRMVAKDAVRHLLRERHGLELCPADVEILPDRAGRPTVVGRWAQRVPAVPTVSISHTAGLAVALVGSGESDLGVGVDLEHIDRMTQDVRALAFSETERRLLTTLQPSDGAEWSLRFWCAKEAVAKALGEGMRRGPQALVVLSADPQNGAVDVAVADDEESIAARTIRDGDFVVATSAISAQRSISA